jgi:hypothetical protein
VPATGVATCPACGAPLSDGREARLAGDGGDARRAGDAGADTIFYPEAVASGSQERSGSGLSSGTILLRAGTAPSGRDGLELKLQPGLIRKGGPSSGQRLTVTLPTTTVGREQGEIRIDDPMLSARHFLIEERGREFFLHDLKSTNGTFLNGHPVRSAQLKSGDEIRAGGSSFIFSLLQVIPCD